MTEHFLPRKRLWGRERRTWSMVREGKLIRSRTDYLLGTDRSLFRIVAVQDPRHNSDHYMVVVHLRGGTVHEHVQYIRGRRRMLLLSPKEPTREDELTALGNQQRGTAQVVAGDFNTDLGETASDGRGTEIAAALKEAGVEYMTAHFLPRKRLWGRERRTWSMVREGKVIRSRTDYLLGTD